MLTPTRKLVCLGFKLDTVDMTVSLPGDKVEKFERTTSELLCKKEPTAREVAGVVGLMVAYSPAVEYGKAHIRGLEKDKNLGLGINRGDFSRTMYIGDRGKQDIFWWCSHLIGFPRRVRLTPPSGTVYTDASLEGWGAHRGSKTAGGRWSKIESTKHINELELWAILFGLKCFAHKEDDHIKIFTDNTTALAYVKNMGGIHSTACDVIAKQIWAWAELKGLWLSIAHIPGKDNVIADYKSRVFTDNTEWALGESIFKDLCKKLGCPTVDLFASRLNRKCVKYVSWGPDPEAWAIDAFSFTWTNELFYIFPPFSLVGRVVQKVMANRTQAIVVAPWWPGQAWFTRL